MISLSWNRVVYTKRMIESLFSHTDTPIDLMIVDNGSNKNTIDFLKSIENKKTKNGSTIKVHYNETNIGVAKGLNAGIVFRDPEQHLMKLDNDMIISDEDSQWLDRMIEIIEFSKPLDNVKIIGLTPFPEGNFKKRKIELSNNKLYTIEDPGPSGILGCGQLIHKDVINDIKEFESKIGGKDVLYGMEDIVFVRKAFHKGYRSAYYSQFHAIHGDYLDLKESVYNQQFKKASLIRTTCGKVANSFSSVDNKLSFELF